MEKLPVKKTWVPMQLTPVGNLGNVMTAMMGSGADGGLTVAMMS